LYEPRDEISLRELYLIFRSGLVAILLAALAAGAAAFIYLSGRPDVYVSTATVQVSVPATSAAGEEVAWLLPPAGIGMNSYRALANRPEVLAEALGVAVNDIGALRVGVSRLDLAAIDTATQAQGQLTVTHTATAPSAAEAAQVANRWASAAAAAAVATMEETVNSNAEASNREVELREADLQGASQTWTEFAEHDNRAVLTSLLNVQQQLQRDALLRSAELENLIVTTGARRDMLQAVLDSRTGASRQSLGAQLNAMVTSGALDSATAAQLERSLSQLPASVTAGSADLMLLVSRTQLETLTSDLAGYVAEQELLGRRLVEAEQRIGELRAELAAVNQTADRLEQVLTRAREAYDSVARLTPLVRLQQGFIGSAAKVVVEAVAPLEPKPRNRLTITLAAAVVAGLLATLVVFLRAAVREPEPPMDKLGLNARQYDIDQTSGSLKRTGEWPAVDFGSGAGDGSPTEPR
jgi:uncharacterized protein involved in exopolysaccharide biosynthesis